MAIRNIISRLLIRILETFSANGEVLVEIASGGSRGQREMAVSGADEFVSHR